MSCSSRKRASVSTANSTVIRSRPICGTWRGGGLRGWPLGLAQPVPDDRRSADCLRRRGTRDGLREAQRPTPHTTTSSPTILMAAAVDSVWRCIFTRVPGGRDVRIEKLTFTLDGVRVLDLGGRVSTAWCSRLLADFGAEVICVESVEGHPVRSASAVRCAGCECCGALLSGEQGKCGSRSVPAAIEALIASAQVVITIRCRGIGGTATAMAAVNPRALVCASHRAWAGWRACAVTGQRSDGECLVGLGVGERDQRSHTI